MNKKIIKTSTIIFITIVTILVSNINTSFKALSDNLNVDTNNISINSKYTYNIQSLSSYKQTLPKDEFDCLVNKIYNFTYFLNSSYPDHEKWFFEKLIPNIGTGTREILFITDSDNNIIGLSALKNEKDEKKICTLYIAENSRGLGLGSQLIENSIQFLGTTKPFITFSEDKLYMFEKFIKKYNWELYEKVDIYGNEYPELCYNGYLSTSKQQVQLGIAKSLTGHNTRNLSRYIGESPIANYFKSSHFKWLLFVY